MKKLKNIIMSSMVLAACSFALCGCGGVKMTEEAKAVQDMIAELPETYSDENDEQISSVRAAYDALSEEEKNTIDISALNNLEQVKSEKEAAEIAKMADEINQMIDKIVVSNSSYNELSKSKNAVSAVMDKVSDFPSESDKLIHYDKLLEKINNISEEYLSTVIDADNDMTALNNIMINLSNINNSSSSSSRYGYACDISSDVSKLSNRLSSIKSRLSEPVSDLKNKCMDGDDFEIALAGLNVIKQIPEDAGSIYESYLNGGSLMDECSEWMKIVQPKAEAQNETEEESNK